MRFKYLKLFIKINLLVFIFTFTSQSQNLVPNYSFEYYTNCPEGYGFLPNAIPWLTARTEGSSDLFNACSKDYFSSVPNNFGGYQSPRTGNGYAGIYVFAISSSFIRTYREYLQVKLKRSLISGEKYIVTFYANLSNANESSIKDMGALISSILPRQEDYPELLQNNTVNVFSNIQLVPQIKSSIFLEDTLNWMKIQGEYIAVGGENYITIGNFENDLQPKHYISSNCYYYIDDVSIYQCDKLVELGNDTTVCKGEPFVINAFTEGATYKWNDNSANSTLSVTSSGLYWVDVNLHGCYTRDSITVTFKDPAFSLGKDTILCKGEVLSLNAKNIEGPFIWNDGSSEQELKISEMGKYWLTTYIQGCKRTDTIYVDFEDPLTIDLGPDTTICGGDILVLNPKNTELTYLWEDGSIESVFEVKAPGNYAVEFHGKACVKRDTIHVFYTDCPNNIPNVITPNEDGKNDSFIVKEIKYDTWNISICNRWGREVYYNSEYKNDWEGKNLSSGIYYYTLLNNKNKRVYKGWIQLFR